MVWTSRTIQGRSARELTALLSERYPWRRVRLLSRRLRLLTLQLTHAALPHLLQAAEDGPRQVADIVNISSIAGRVAWNGYGVYNLTKFGVNGFTEGPASGSHPAARARRCPRAGWCGDRAGLAQQA